MSVQKNLLAAAGAVAGAGIMGASMAKKSLSAAAAEKAKQSLQEHREAKQRSKGKFGKKNKPVEGEKA